MPAALGLDRIESGRKEKPNAFEEVANLQAVRQIFRNLSNSQPDILPIDGTPPVDFVHRQILASLIDGVLKKRHCSKAYGCDEPLYCAYRLSDTCRWARMQKAAGLTV